MDTHEAEYRGNFRTETSVLLHFTLDRLCNKNTTKN